MNHPKSRSKWWQKLLIDEDRRSPASRCLASDEDGMVVLAAIATVLFLLVLLGLLGNVLLVVHQKMEVQSAADAVAGSVSVQMARGLNTVTTINHLMGEILGLVVVHDAIGGDRLPNCPKQDTDSEKDALEIFKNTLEGLGGKASAYNDVSKDVKAEAALLKGYKDLMRRLTEIYGIMIVGKTLQQLGAVPYVGPVLKAIGIALETIGQVLEQIAHMEWRVLKIIEQIASATDFIARMLFDQLLPALRRAALDAQQKLPQTIRETVQGVARSHQVEAVLYPKEPKLPVVDDPASEAANKEEMIESQIMRASWPWTVYHRQPIMQFTAWMKFSRFRMHYRQETEEYAKRKAFDLYQEGHYLLVLEDMRPQTKGQESWATGNSQRADQLFSVLAFTYRPRLNPVSPTIFLPGQQGGTVTFSQAMIYNANPQTGKQNAQEQPVIGWDTLNWAPPRERGRIFEHPHPGASDQNPWPAIKQNWQSKLTPVSLLGEVVSQMDEPFATQLKRVDPASPLARTH